MRVRIRLHPLGKEYWFVETKRWYEFDWQYENLFAGDEAYKRAKDYAVLLKHPQIKDIT